MLETPSSMKELVSTTGLSKEYVASELRRYLRWLEGAPVRGRLSISYRVMRALYAAAMDVAHNSEGTFTAAYTCTMDRLNAQFLEKVTAH